MKKSLFFGFGVLAIACVALFTACEIESVSSVIEEGLFGSAQVTVNDGESTQSLSYESSIIDYFTKEDTATGQTYVAAIDFSANIDLSQADLQFPFMAFQITDTVPGNYTCDQILTEQRLHNFNFDSIAALIRDPSGFNMVIIAVNDSSWYISNSGSIIVNTFPAMGHNVEGTFNNVGAYFFTTADVESLSAAIESGSEFSIYDYIHPVTISGSFTSRRAAVVHTLVQEAFYNGGLCNL